MMRMAMMFGILIAVIIYLTKGGFLTTALTC